MGESKLYRNSISGISRAAFGSLSSDVEGLADVAQVQLAVVENNVDVATGDGVCDAAIFYPAGDGMWPAVLIWTDVLGLRPVFHDMGRRLAAQGYVVLVPNPFYRWTRAPVVEGAINLQDLEARAKVFALVKLITLDGIDRDSQSFMAFLDARPQTDKTRKAGVHGYCMGGQFAIRSAAAVRDRIGAVGSFHGTGLVTDDPLSPHRLVGGTDASYLVAIAQNDDRTQPEAKDVLNKIFADTGRPATVRVFAADHGWCVKGGSTYDEPLSETAWSELNQLYKQALMEG